MKRYRLTTSGVCDCMIPADNGLWVEFKDADQMLSDLRTLAEAVIEAHTTDKWDHAEDQITR